MITMYPGKVNSPQTELASAIDATQTSIPVLDASKLPAAPNLATIGTGEDAETVLYTGVSGNDLTGVTRGFQGAAKSWGAGVKVARLFTAYDYDALKENIEDLDASKETPAGAQAKANAAETNAKNHASGLVGSLANLLTTAKSNLVAAINEIFGKVEDVEDDLDSHLADYAQHGVTMGHENDLYVAKIRPLFGFTPLEVNYGGSIYAIATDDEFVYVGGRTTQTVRKLRKSDLSQVAESANYGGGIYAIATDDEFVYIGGATTRTVRKLRKSDLSQVAESASYGGIIEAIATDDEFVYVGGTTQTVRVIENRDLIKIIRRYQ